MNDKDKTDKEKIDYIRQCFADGHNDYTKGNCVDGQKFMDSLDADIEREEDEEDRLLIIERENSPTIKLNLNNL